MTSTTLDRSGSNVSVRLHDISDTLLSAAHHALVAAIDIETTGLDWTTEKIATVQVAVPRGPIEIVRVEETSEPPALLAALLATPDVLKVFHHAMFDLRFIRAQWGMQSLRTACTKVASKLSDPDGQVGHGLTDLVAHYLGVSLDKTQQLSDWASAALTSEQVEYAADDVRYLVPLLYSVLHQLRGDGLEQLALNCFEHIPTRVELEVRGYADVFTY